MRNIWLIARREYHHYFISPIAYAVAFAILLILGIIFYANIVGAMLQQIAPGMEIVFGPLVSLLIFTTPAITMRSIAEENKMGTLELLLTAPVRDWEIILGKWLGGFLFLGTVLLATWLYPIVLNQLVSPGIEQGVLVSGYLGIVMMSAAIIAIGVATSSLFGNQIAAFFATEGILLLLWVIGAPSQAMGMMGGSLLRYLDMSEHFYPTFYRGIVEVQDIIYFLSLTFLALFIGKISIEVRRWR
ncbi:MAG: ABC transporter permease [Anaerolineae bacterium]|nr:ABC transporter permease [Anaerolineae bacterium]